jgi:integrase
VSSKPFLSAARGVWFCKWKPDPAGKWVKAKLGEHGEPYPPSRPPKKPPAHIQERRDEMAEIERRAKLGIGPAVGGTKGLARYVKDYQVAFAATHKPGSARMLALCAGNILKFAETRGVKTLQEVSKAFCRDYLEHRAATICHNSLKTEKGMLSPIWSRAVEDELIPANPWKLVKVPGKRAEHTPRFWSSDEVRRIADACVAPWLRQLVIVMANTGLRISAALAMEWSWVDWGRSLVSIPPGLDKAGKGYQISLTEGAREILQPMHALSSAPLLFPSPAGGGPRNYHGVHRLFMAAVEKAGVPPGTPHDLRHTFARHLVKTAPLNVVQAALGHSSLMMTQRYTKVGGESTAEHMQGFRLGVGYPSTEEPRSAQP